MSKIVAAMLVKNEDWCLAATIPAALDWCDEVVVVDDYSTDNTAAIAQSFDRVTYYQAPKHDEFWPEMQLRQFMAEKVLEKKPEFFALVDADELLPVPMRMTIRLMAGYMRPDTCLCPNPRNPWNSLSKYRVDECRWTKGGWSTLIRLGKTKLTWKPKANGYQFHGRVPRGIVEEVVRGGENWGTIHLQFANYKRRLAKHLWYAFNEVLRGWAQPQAASSKYSAAFDESGLQLQPIPKTWFRKEEKKNININDAGWYLVQSKEWYNKNENKLKDIRIAGKTPNQVIEELE